MSDTHVHEQVTICTGVHCCDKHTHVYRCNIHTHTYTRTPVYHCNTHTSTHMYTHLSTQSECSAVELVTVNTSTQALQAHMHFLLTEYSTQKTNDISGTVH